MPRNLVLKEVELEGFKYASSKLKINLDYNVVLLLGPVGSGKSTILDAIEFALFGTTYDIKSTRILRLDDLINDFNEFARVRVKLKDLESGQTYEIIRRKERGRRTRTRIYVDGEQVLKSVSVDVISEYTRNLTGLSVDDFSKQVYIRQRELEALIYGTPTQRAEAIDRLFGIEILENIFKAISLGRFDEQITLTELQIAGLERQLSELDDISKMKDELKAVNDEVNKVKDKLERVNSDIRYYEGVLEDLNPKRPEYEKLKESITGYRAIINNIKMRISEIRQEASISDLLPKLNELRFKLADLLVSLLAYKEAEELRKEEVTEENLPRFLELLQETLDLVDEKRRDIEEEINKLNSRLIALEAQKDGLLARIGILSRHIKELEIYEKEREKLLSAYGTPQEVKNKITEIESKLAEIGGLIEYEKALLSITKEVLKRKERFCPVCGKEITGEDLLKIEKAITSMIKSEYAEYLANYSRLTQEKKNLEDILERLKELEEKVTDRKRLEIELSEAEVELNNLNKQISDVESMLEDLGIMLDEIIYHRSLVHRDSQAIEKYRDYVKLLSELKFYENKLKEALVKIRELQYDPEYHKYVEDELAELKAKRSQIERELETLMKKRDELEQKIEKIIRLREEIKVMREKLKRLKEYREKLMKVKQVFRDMQAKIRAEMLQRITNKMNEIFNQVYVYSDYDKLDIRIEIITTKEKYRRSVYEIYARRTSDNSWVPALKRMSDGQKAILALSFLAALFMTTPHNIGVMILDEPLPNIDDACKEAMVKMLSRLNEVRQVIIATQDPRFVKVLEEGVKSWGEDFRGVVYKLRHGFHGPLIEVKEYVSVPQESRSIEGRERQV